MEKGDKRFEDIRSIMGGFEMGPQKKKWEAVSFCA